MLQLGRDVRARAVAWWRRSHADPDKRDFRRIGLLAFGVVGVSVVLARLTQDTAAAGAIRALAITVFAIAAIALLGVVILMGEEVVDEMDASDPMRARQGGAYGSRIKQFLRDARHGTWVWITSIPGKVGGLRREVTRESLARMAVASVDALGGVPPADAGPPAGAGRLAQPIAAPLEADPAAPDDPTEPGRLAAAPLRARRRALTASELLDHPPATTRRRPAEPRSARRAGRTRRSRRAATRRSRFTDTGARSRD
jgi:hypothetical protein